MLIIDCEKRAKNVIFLKAFITFSLAIDMFNQFVLIAAMALDVFEMCLY